VSRTSVLLFVALFWAASCAAQNDSTPTDKDAARDPAVATMDAATDKDAAKDSTLDKKDWAAIGDDTISVRAGQFDTTAVRALQADPEYDYDRDLHVNTLWWERLKEWIGHWLQRLFGSKTGGWVFGHLHWAILAFAVVFLLFFFRKRLFHSALIPESGRPRQVTTIEENIEALDLDKLLAKAEKAQDWRTALRYQYLKVLRRLMDEGLIKWQPRYTDRDYLGQLKESAKRAAFSEASFLFKWAWYGDAPMDETRYRAMLPAFVRLHTPNGSDR